MSGRRAEERGRWGEEQVERELQRRGYIIRARRYRSRYGEIDLIAENEAFLAFVEVKFRSSCAYGSGLEAVDARKQCRLRQTAELYLSANPTEKQPRFDVAEVCPAEEAGRVTITYRENAF